MKIYLTDICSNICPDDVMLEKADNNRTARIKATVFENIGEPMPSTQKRPMRIVLRTALIAAIIAVLLGVTAYAVTSFSMNRNEINTDDGAVGFWREVD